MSKFYSILASAGLMASLAAAPAHAIGWPANHEGVMLQGFYWDSYKATSWAQLTSQSDELSKYFNLIWIPNSAKSEGGMGYHPIYWFTNHNTDFGTEAELRTMIQTFKEKGTGMIADVIINHRNGVSNWTNFPEETWNGKTYKIGPEGICSGDEVKNASGQAKPTGNADTGENWDGARDLDHTNANVQANIKDYIKCLLTDFGYAGVRYDFVKGYDPQYTKMYNQANDIKYSVGEYWDGSYDAVADWIDGTGKESAAFDFPFKYQVNKCFNGGAHKYSELVWKANGTTDQPAGMIHYGYGQLAVTFIDNHDTYRDGSKMTGDVLQANAFMLSSPGTPCVFWPHYTAYKSQIQAMIDARNGVGIHNCSPVNVLEVNDNCYVAEVTGTKGKLWIKLGNSSKTPGAVYTKKASGNGYEIWTTSEGGGDDPVGTYGDLYVRGKMTNDWGVVEDWKMTPGKDGVYTISGKDFAAGEEFKIASGDDAWTYAITSNQKNMGADEYDVTFEKGDNDNMAFAMDMKNVTITLNTTTKKMTVTGDYVLDTPEKLYLIGNIKDSHWTTADSPEMTKEGNTFSIKVTLEPQPASAKPTRSAETQQFCYFSFTSALGADWDALNKAAHRFGAHQEDVEITHSTEVAMKAYPNNVTASGCKAFKIKPGTYNITADFDTNTIKATIPSGIGEINAADEAPATWFNLQGQRVENPEKGLYIRVQNGKSAKVIR